MNYSQAQTQALCSSCSSRPAIPRVDRTTDPPRTLLLCDPCYVTFLQRRFDAYLASLGRDLETTLQQGGSPLPEDLTGEQVIRGFLEESREYATSDQAKRHQALVDRLWAEARTELPEASTFEQVRDRLIAKYMHWMETHPEGTE